MKLSPLVQDIINESVQTSQSFVDEIYLQLVKQIINNRRVSVLGVAILLAEG